MKVHTHTHTVIINLFVYSKVQNNFPAVSHALFIFRHKKENPYTVCEMSVARTLRIYLTSFNVCHSHYTIYLSLHYGRNHAINHYTFFFEKSLHRCVK